jgi:hypothetical protein
MSPESDTSGCQYDIPVNAEETTALFRAQKLTRSCQMVRTSEIRGILSDLIERAGSEWQVRHEHDGKRHETSQQPKLWRRVEVGMPCESISIRISAALPPDCSARRIRRIRSLLDKSNSVI